MEIKIPFYNILNMFLTGIIFISMYVMIFPDTAVAVLNNDIIKNLGAGPEIVVTICAFAIAYEFGLIINRMGSIILEPFLKWTKLIPFDDDYVKFNIKKKEYPIMSTLSREYALSRTGVVIFLILLLLSLFTSNWALAIVFGCVTVIYYLSCRKHSTKIVNLMQGEDQSNLKE